MEKPRGRTVEGIVHLTSEEIARAGIEVLRIKKEPFTIHREFPATIQPNENELAEVTPLIRGRVVEVSVDVGKDVKKGERLALLDSTDLGVAEGAYLKAAARQHKHNWPMSGPPISMHIGRSVWPNCNVGKRR